jgi:hypothetical protein
MPSLLRRGSTSLALRSPLFDSGTNLDLRWLSVSRSHLAGPNRQPRWLSDSRSRILKFFWRIEWGVADFIHNAETYGCVLVVESFRWFMKSFLNSLRNGVLVTTGLLIVPVLGLAPKAMAQDPAAPADKAPTLVGQCRAANKRTPIYSTRNPASEVVALLEAGNAVRLSENGGENGLIGVSNPKAGFVHSPNLKDCPGKPKPPMAEPPKPDKPIAGICRKVVQPQGLIVRNEAGNVAPIVGSLALNEKVTLAEPIETVERDDGRVWIKVVKPVAGWTSNGFVKQQFRNLGACE